MKIKLRATFFILISLVILSCQYSSESKMENKIIQDNCKQEGSLSCKLTSAELQKRKTTVIESLRRKIIQKKELTDGYAFEFSASDSMIDELTEFIKTERQCCDFFDFSISIGGDHSKAWLQLTGPSGAKDFIKAELEL